MADLKTKQNQASVPRFLAGVEDEKRRKDARIVLRLMREITGEKPAMWGSSIVGYGQYHYRYESGREGDFLRIGFSPRKQNLAIYVMPGLDDHEALLEKLGKHETGRSCLYIKRLSDVDTDVLRTLVERAWKDMARRYPD